MDDPDLTIRAMLADDLPALVPIHLAAFAGYRSGLLGPRFAQRFYRWFLEYPEAFGLVAAGPEGLRGFVAGAKKGTGSLIYAAVRTEIGRALLTRPALLVHPQVREGIGHRLRQKFRPAPPPPELPGGPNLPTMSLVAIGVATAWRGRGVGSRLIEAFEAEALRRGYARGMLGVRLDNVEAQGVYRRNGWAEFPGPPGARSTNFVKLLSPVDPAGEHPARASSERSHG